MFEELLTEKLTKKGASIVGFADLSALPEEVRRGYRYGVSIAVALNPRIVSEIPSGPHPEYYNEYSNVSDKLHGLCEYAAELITGFGFHAFPQSKRFVRQDKNFRTLLPHKTVATRAGIGCIGKCALLVTEQYGSAVRLTSVLTDLKFETDAPVETPRCGDCMECVSHCPAKAIHGSIWTAGIDRDELINPKVCKSTVIQRGEPFGLTEGTCGICISVCPYTRRYIRNA